MGIFRGGLYGFKPTKWIFYCYKKIICVKVEPNSVQPLEITKKASRIFYGYATVTILRCFSLNQNWTNIFNTMQQNCIWRTALLLKLKVQTRVHTRQNIDWVKDLLKVSNTQLPLLHTHTLTPRVDALQFTRQALYKPVGFRIVQCKHSEVTFGIAWKGRLNFHCTTSCYTTLHQRLYAA